MSKRPSVADAISRKLREGESPEPAPTGPETATPAPVLPGQGENPGLARTRVGKKFITFPVSSEAKLQFDMLAVQSGTKREELMRQALRDLFAKHGQSPID